MTQPQEIDDAAFDDIATEAARTVKAAPRLGRRLAPVVAELDAALPRHVETTDDVRTELDRYERDTVVRERIGAELQTLFALPGGPLWHDHPPFVLTPPELRHVYVPDPAGTLPNRYTLQWGQADGFPGTGIDARPDAAQGTFSASEYATGNTTFSAFAGIGVKLRPTLPWSHLSIRPFVQWTGGDMLGHHDAMPSLQEQRRARASGAVGILVNSWDLAGGSFHTDADHPIDLWDRVETNPNGLHDYEGVVDVNALAVQILASNQRRYAIWVYCWAYVESQTGYAVATRASAWLRGHMPYLFVEEVII